MNKQEIMQKAAEFIDASEKNVIQKEFAISENIAGIRMYEKPLFSFGSAQDPLFNEFKKTEAIGAHFVSPAEWLSGAKTVISLFLPFTKEVKSSNRAHALHPSPEWLHARIEGQAFINDFLRYLQNVLIESGYRAVVPSLDQRFWAKVGMKEMIDHKDPSPGQSVFTSNWSERHVAWLCGLGTFGLSKGLITKKGVAGRLGSIIADMQLEPDNRDYTGLYDYCTFCGACILKCPAHAISMEKGKEHPLCCDYLDQMEEMFSPRYGCGKCQTGVPCESGIPAKRNPQT